MGSIIDINDTLEITEEQGFPTDVFDLARHQANPITIDDVGNRVFSFRGKVKPRIFQLDPVRVFFYQNQTVNGQTTWLAWGEVLIQSLHIEKNPDAPHTSKRNESDPGQWVTSGTYTMLKVYDPEYQRIATHHQTPEGFDYFAVSGQ
ncbi:MAG: hypothetical protein QNJ16_21970 [Rhodobacter sp.]|nr:hypothetical protein [Rhodobacter sp.]